MILRDAIYFVNDAIFFGKIIIFNETFYKRLFTACVCMTDQSFFFQENMHFGRDLFKFFWGLKQFSFLEISKKKTKINI